jgi:hypothetical protein
MADDQGAVVDEDEALLAPIRERVRKTQADAEFQLLRTDPRIGPVVLRSPTEAEYRLYVQALGEETTKSTATHNLFVTVCVHPPAGGNILTRYPGFLHSKPVQGALGYLTGATSQATGKG